MQVMSLHLQLKARKILRALQTRAAEYCTLSLQQLERLASLLISKHIGYTFRKKPLAISAPYTLNV